jgi:hypothetical protein
MEGCASKREIEENLSLSAIMELIEEENAFLGAGFP